MDLDLSKRTAVVCGSTQGIGFASAQELAAMGANCVLIARNEERLIHAVNKLDKSKGQTHSYLIADFSKPNELKGVIENWASNGNEANILINNTGGPAGGPIVNAQTNEFESAFTNHLICNHVLATTLIPGMKNSGYGRNN